jgi:hypothetical protein
MEESFHKQPRLWMVAFYLFMVAGFLYVKPAIAFGEDGHIKPFGTQKKGSTVFPVWWWMFIFAALSYFLVTFLTKYSL